MVLFVAIRTNYWKDAQYKLAADAAAQIRRDFQHLESVLGLFDAWATQYGGGLVTATPTGRIYEIPYGALTDLHAKIEQAAGQIGTDICAGVGRTLADAVKASDSPLAKPKSVTFFEPSILDQEELDDDKDRMSIALSKAQGTVLALPLDADFDRHLVGSPQDHLSPYGYQVSPEADPELRIPKKGTPEREIFDSAYIQRATESAQPEYQVSLGVVPISSCQCPHGVLDQSRYTLYRTMLDQGDDLPPISVTLGPDGRHNVTDGCHRVHAGIAHGLTEIPALISTFGGLEKALSDKAKKIFAAAALAGASLGSGMYVGYKSAMKDPIRPRPAAVQTIEAPPQKEEIPKSFKLFSDSAYRQIHENRKLPQDYKGTFLDVNNAKPADYLTGVHPDLHPMFLMESVGGTDFDHKAVDEDGKPLGAYKTAFGHLGLVPRTAHETYQNDKGLQAKYPGMDNPKFITYAVRNSMEFYRDVSNATIKQMREQANAFLTMKDNPKLIEQLAYEFPSKHFKPVDTVQGFVSRFRTKGRFYRKMKQITDNFKKEHPQTLARMAETWRSGNSSEVGKHKEYSNNYLSAVKHLKNGTLPDVVMNQYKYFSSGNKRKPVVEEAQPEKPEVEVKPTKRASIPKVESKEHAPTPPPKRIFGPKNR
jgi:hypothetical protein